MKKNDAQISIVGGLAPPIGGVTTFLSQISKSTKVLEIIDIYPRAGKKSLNEKHFISPYHSSIFNFIWLWFVVSFSRKRVFHFNFSGARALLFFLLLLKLDNKYVLQLHYGDPFKGVERSTLLFFLYKISLRRFDGIIVLGRKQELGYRKIGASSEKMLFAKSYVSDWAALLAKKESKSVSQRKIFLISGYPQDIYRIKETVEFFAARPFLKLLVCIYGNEDDVSRFLDKSSLSQNVTLYNHLGREEFLSLMGNCDCYLRPAMEDSFGIAVAEAIDMGLTVIASDVCARHRGAFIFDTPDFKSFEKAVDSYVECGDPRLPVSDEELFFMRDYEEFMCVSIFNS